MEILRGVERRRRWSWADKPLIVAEFGSASRSIARLIDMLVKVRR